MQAPPVDYTPGSWNPRFVSNILLVAILFASCYLNYWSYSREFHANPLVFLDIVNGTAAAPAQYRIGVVDSAEFLTIHSHIALRVVLSLVDLVAGLAACFTLLSLLRRSRTYRKAPMLGRCFGELAFLVLVQYYLAWLVWYQRPETLTTAALLSFALALVSLPPILEGLAGSLLIAAGLLLITAAQSFVRADVALTLNLGLLAICLFRRSPSLSLPRGVLAGASTLGVILAAGIQFVLMHKVFPQARYGSTPVIQLFNNLKDRLGYLPFLLFMLPFFWTFWRVAVKKAHASAANTAALIGATVFLCMWSVVGVTQEVRIFMPFAMLLIPLTVSLAMDRVVLAFRTAPKI